MVKNSPAKCRILKRLGFDPCVGKIPWRRKWQLTVVFLPEKSHGQRNLVVTVRGISRESAMI